MQFFKATALLADPHLAASFLSAETAILRASALCGGAAGPAAGEKPGGPIMACLTISVGCVPSESFKTPYGDGRVCMVLKVSEVR